MDHLFISRTLGMKLSKMISTEAHSGILKIGIYNEPAGSGIGGSESMVAVLAEALSREHQVELLHHIPALSADRLAESSGTDLSNVRLRYFEPDYNPTERHRDPRRRYEASRKWNAALSEPYDLFIAVMHGKPPFCHADKGVLVVLYPTHTEHYVQIRGKSLIRSALRRPFEYLYQNWEWKKRMEGYQLKTAISDFSRLWTQRRWNIDCEVAHPPVDNHFRHVEKASIILSVGRFAIEWEGHTKKQLEMLTAFRQMDEEGLQDWEYFCVGGLRDAPGNRAYFERLCSIGAEGRARVIANVKRDELKSLYERASIFWHAAGYGEDENVNPVLMEHFGIATVEAMAAGCVPVVINKGGQREIVEHGINGFLWNTLEELKEYTSVLISDGQLRARMSESARLRAKFFSREEAVAKFLRLLHLPLSR